MSANYTPLDLKKFKIHNKKSNALNTILSLIGLITVLVLLILIYMLYKKSTGI